MTSFGSSSWKKALAISTYSVTITGTGTSFRSRISKVPARRIARTVEVETGKRPIVLKRRADQRIELALVAHNASNDRSEPGGVRPEIGVAIQFLAETMFLIFGDDLQDAGPADIHLIKCLNGCEAGGPTLIDLFQWLIRRGVRHLSAPNLCFSSIMVRAARAANPPLSPSDRRALAQA